MIRLLATLGGVLAALIAVKVVLANAKAEGLAECQASYQAAAIEAERANARTAILKLERNQEINDALRKRAEAESVRAASAARELDRVRLAIAAVTGSASSPASAPSGADAATLGRLLAEGAELVEEGRGRVERLAAQVVGLQDYAVKVCRSF